MHDSVAHCRITFGRIVRIVRPPVGSVVSLKWLDKVWCLGHAAGRPLGEAVARSKIVLSGQESGELERRIYASTVAVRDRQRAEIVVLSAAGISQHQIAARVGVSRVTVNLWCQRFLANRLAGLEDATGRGRKPSVPL